MPTPTPVVSPPRTGTRTATAPRLAILDGLRFVAAMAVLAYHFTGLRTQFWGVPTQEAFPRAHQVGVYGFLGVEMFFFIRRLIFSGGSLSAPLAST